MREIPATPVQRLDGVSTRASALWVKRDDLTDPEFGGNKVRKLRHVFAEAERAGARRLVLVAPAGSHQVLATALFARPLGLSVVAVLSPQARTDHAARVFRAIVAAGVEVHPARGAAVARAVWRLRRPGDFVLPLGGSTTQSLAGHLDAAAEVARSVAQGEMPSPDVVVVALASAGTAVGLAAGFAAHAMPTEVVGVCATGGRAEAGAFVMLQLAKLARLRPELVAGAARRLRIDGAYLGRGYSVPTPEGVRATEVGRALGLTLDPAYTAKAFAAALDRAGKGAHPTVLFWQTLSSSGLDRLLCDAPDEDALPPSLRALLVPHEAP